MKLIYYSMHANNDPIFIKKLRDMGHSLTVIDRECKDYTRDMHMAQELMNAINSNRADAVFSFDYFPIISMVCDVCHISYYSWVYDCPHQTLRAKCINLPCNHIGVFDPTLAEKLRAEGVNTVYYMPLAVDPVFFRDAQKNCKNSYSTDVSFLGSLYTGAYSYFDGFKSEIGLSAGDIASNEHSSRILYDNSHKLSPSPLTGISSKNSSESEFHADSADKNISVNDAPSYINRLEKLIQKQCFDYEHTYIDDAMTDSSIVDPLYDFMEKKGLVLNEDYNPDRSGIVSDNILLRQVTILERRELIRSIAGFCHRQNRAFRLYTASDASEIKELKKGKNLFGPIDYLTDMSSLFYDSKINLNITLRSIRTGIPLRALDIMASGGFLLTNPQADMARYFKEGVDFAVYRSVDDCLKKIDYYLTHEDERKQIAQNGLDRISRLMTFESSDFISMILRNC